MSPPAGGGSHISGGRCKFARNAPRGPFSGLDRGDAEVTREPPGFSEVDAEAARLLQSALFGRSPTRRIGITESSADPVVDDQALDIPAEQVAVVGYQRGPKFHRAGRNHEIEVGLQPSTGSELRLDHSEAVRNGGRHRDNLDLAQLLMDAPPVLFTPSRALRTVDQLCHDDGARQHAVVIGRRVQSVAHRRDAVQGVDDDVGIEQPDHRPSGGSVVPPALRASRRMRRISSAGSPFQPPPSAMKSPRRFLRSSPFTRWTSTYTSLMCRRTAWKGSLLSCSTASSSVVGRFFSGIAMGYFLGTKATTRLRFLPSRPARKTCGSRPKIPMVHAGTNRKYWRTRRWLIGEADAEASVN